MSEEPTAGEEGLRGLELMQCSSCGSEIRESAQFCGPPAPTPQRLPPAHLADRIRADRAGMEGERKQVTILFADLVDSMELARRIDPEDWRSIMDRFFRLLADGVHDLEGNVNDFTGDGIMAIFGAPIAHEDHARRACLAALKVQRDVAVFGEEFQRSHDLELAIRIGLNSGEVVVGTIGDRGDMTYTAIGHSVGLAQRMEQAARTGRDLPLARAPRRSSGATSGCGSRRCTRSRVWVGSRPSSWRGSRRNRTQSTSPDHEA